MRRLDEELSRTQLRSMDVAQYLKTKTSGPRRRSYVVVIFSLNTEGVWGPRPCLSPRVVSTPLVSTGHDQWS